MAKRLEDYLQEIDHYLAVKSNREDILSEIRSHILERAETEWGAVDEEAIAKVIPQYGSPRQVAEKYLEGDHIISPALKKYLVMYTGVLFCIHALMIIICWIFGWSISFSPLVHIPNIRANQLLISLIMAFFTDLGIVGLIMYSITQEKKDTPLPWPRIPKKWLNIPGVMPAKPAIFALILLGFLAAMALFLKSGTLLFMSLDFPNFKPLLEPLPSLFYSLLILIWIAGDVLFYGLRFITKSTWQIPIQDLFHLVLLWILYNQPIKIIPSSQSLEETADILMEIGGILVFILIISVSFNLVKHLFAVVFKSRENRENP